MRLFALDALGALAADRGASLEGGQGEANTLETLRDNANDLARAETVLTQLIDKQWAERVEAAARDRDRQIRALANFVDLAFARLDQVPGVTNPVEPATPTPTTYPTPSRPCYRFQDGGSTFYAACGEDEPFLVVGSVSGTLFDVDGYSTGVCVGLDAVDARLAAAGCSVIDAEELGPPASCGDAITGRVHSV